LIQLFSPDDGHVVARNMLRIEINIQRKKLYHRVGFICKIIPPSWFYLQDYITELVLFARLYKDAARSQQRPLARSIQPTSIAYVFGIRVARRCMRKGRGFPWALSAQWKVLIFFYVEIRTLARRNVLW
jgi:hypothetical protein